MDPYTFTLVIWRALADPKDGHSEHRIEDLSEADCRDAVRELRLKPRQGRSHCIDTRPDRFVIGPSPR
jgi:hypothetical protein